MPMAPCLLLGLLQVWTFMHHYSLHVCIHKRACAHTRLSSPLSLSLTEVSFTVVFFNLNPQSHLTPEGVLHCKGLSQDKVCEGTSLPMGRDI